MKPATESKTTYDWQSLQISVYKTGELIKSVEVKEHLHVLNFNLEEFMTYMKNLVSVCESEGIMEDIMIEQKGEEDSN